MNKHVNVDNGNGGDLKFSMQKRKNQDSFATGIASPR